MPELPEVETVRRSLTALVKKRQIERVDVKLARIVRRPDVDLFCANLAGQRIHRVERKGKFILFDLGEQVLVSHLRMEGRYGLYPTDDPIALHTHVFFHLDGGQTLRYQDVRQFGTMDLLLWQDIDQLEGLATLGVEPLDPAMTTTYLAEKFAKRNAPIKAVLLDQKVVAGLGNIYVDETLYEACVHPEAKASALPFAQVERIHEAMIRIIATSIELGGSSIKSYVNGYGEPGRFQFALQVYGRKGQPCPRCGQPIHKGRVAGRGTHYCLTCQRPPFEVQVDE